jgi:hypothetical protein
VQIFGREQPRVRVGVFVDKPLVLVHFPSPEVYSALSTASCVIECA